MYTFIMSLVAATHLRNPSFRLGFSGLRRLCLTWLSMPAMRPSKLRYVVAWQWMHRNMVPTLENWGWLNLGLTTLLSDYC